MKLEKYLIEATIASNAPDTGGIAGGPDDFPVQMGQKFIKIPYKNRLTSYNKVWTVDHSEWKWDEFVASKGAEDPDTYSETLKRLKDVIPDFDFYHRLKRKVPDKLVVIRYGRTPIEPRDPEIRLGKDSEEVMRVPDDIKERNIKLGVTKMSILLEKIDKLLVESPIYGKEKSKLWKKYKEEIVSAKDKSVLTKLMATIEKDTKVGKLTDGELMDLIDKVDQKSVNLGKK